jgi:hypothetical protein
MRSPTILFRRAAVDEAGGFNAVPLKVTGDWHLALKVTLRHGVIFVPEALAYHRTHVSNISSFSARLPDPATIEREHFLPLKDVFDHLPEDLRDLEALRIPAYESVATKMHEIIRALEHVGRHTERDELIERVRAYVPTFVPAPRRLEMRDLAMRAAEAAIKLATYRRPEQRA